MTSQLLHIYFQSGEFITSNSGNSWFTDLFINAFGAFVGIAGALGLYYWQTWRQQKDKLKYVCSLLESIIQYAKAQADNCKILSAKLNEKPTKFHLLHFQANYDLNRLVDKVDQEGFYHAYLRKYKRGKNSYKAFKNLYGYIDFIDQTIDELKSFLEKEYLSITNRKKGFVEKLELGIEKSALLLRNPSFKNQPELLSFLNHSLLDYHNNKIDVEDLDYPFEKFIMPVKDHLAQNYPGISEVNEIMIALKDASIYYSGIEFQSKALAEDLMEFHDSLIGKSEELAKSTKTLRTDFSISL